MSLLIRDATVVTVNPAREIFYKVSIVVEQDRISAIGPEDQLPHKKYDEIIDARDFVLIPGFIQTHVHLCQTLFRGLADDLELLDWLCTKIFPFEAAHNERSMYYSALLGISELFSSGTTTILDMGSIRYETEIIRAIGETGLRAFVGKAMMDINDLYPKLCESTSEAITSTRLLAERWHNSFDGRIKYAVAPRFVLSCSDALLQDASALLVQFPGMLFHTHASENRSEIQKVRERSGMENIEFLNHLGLLSRRSCLAHCIHLNETEIDVLCRTGANVVHCPSSNLKLGSGIARIPTYLQRGINVSLGADGAPCNNTLDMFQEMRLASLVQKPFFGPTSMPAQTVFEMATIHGATALGLQHEIGSIEIGKKADLVLLDLRGVSHPADLSGNLYSAIVYSGSPHDVHSVMIDGKWVYRDRKLIHIDEEKLRHDAKHEIHALYNRIDAV
jgi:5-methylthioadenosine/S-adenosylhomocysteine deaminase